MEKAIKFVTPDGDVVTEDDPKYRCDLIYNIFPYRKSWSIKNLKQ